MSERATDTTAGWVLIMMAVVMAVLGPLFWFSQKETDKWEAECRAIGGEPFKARDGRVCLAKGTVLKP